MVVVDSEKRQHIFVLHGIDRNRGAYRRDWSEFAGGGVTVHAPRFSWARFPGHGGYVLNPAAYAWFDGYVRRRLEGNVVDEVVLFGHSAGAQFAQREVLFCEALPLERTRVFLCNAGWYTWPDRRIEYPYGFGGLPGSAEDRVCRVRRWHVLLGVSDTGSKRLRLTPETELQGRHRLERGQRFFAALCKAHARADCVLVRCAHDHTCMARVVQDRLQQKKEESPINAPTYLSLE
jgi:hypothetical protein